MAAERGMSEEEEKLGDLGIAEAASPISSRPPAPNFEEMAEGSGGGASSNRWPRQETLALLQIRSEMDSTFRDATLKGPLWEHVSRKLGELGYKRSAKKCKEKFENVHKYYKRTKEGRGGRQDGKSYKFFDQLEALHHHTPTAAVSQPPPVMMTMPQPEPAVSLPAPPDLFGMSFSSGNDSSSDDEDMEDAVNRKRKRGEGGNEKMMEFFEGLLKEVMQKQESMQQRFLETIEKREQDRTIREEAWKRQDMARIAREHELMAQERAISASRDAAIIDFLQKLTGKTIHLPSPSPLSIPSETAIEAGETSSSRWPKAEVLALIKLRGGMEAKYQEAGPKGPLWEEISAQMQQLGYKRSAKRCKEKWENINKYFKKVKESNKKRPQDAKTCPYFDELDALYRKKLISSGDAVAEVERKQQGDGDDDQMQMNPYGIGGQNQPEDILNKGHQQIDNYSDEDDDEEDYEEVGETEEEIKMVYKMQFQRQNGGTGTGTGTASSFVAMVQ